MISADRCAFKKRDVKWCKEVQNENQMLVILVGSNDGENQSWASLPTVHASINMIALINCPFRLFCNILIISSIPLCISVFLPVK